MTQAHFLGVDVYFPITIKYTINIIRGGLADHTLKFKAGSFFVIISNISWHMGVDVD